MKSATIVCAIVLGGSLFTVGAQPRREGARQRPIVPRESTRVHDRVPAPSESQLVKPPAVRRAVPDRVVKVEKDDYRKVFDRIQSGMNSGNVSTFSQHFGAQVYVKLRGGESGYYSASQAYYLLENYLKTRRLAYFDFTTIGESESNPYATGSVAFNTKGSREIAQIYVSLSLVGERWAITQINIY